MALSWTLRVVQLISRSTDACGKNLQDHAAFNPWQENCLLSPLIPLLSRDIVEDSQARIEPSTLVR
jgi:hypothetical protein